MAYVLSLLFLTRLAGATAGASDGARAEGPHLVPLRRESVPVYRRGVVISHKTTYSGTVSLGNPAQQFDMVFDTGSAHVVVPSEACRSSSCLTHRRLDVGSSPTASAINLDGSRAQPGRERDAVKIGYGTGEVVGELARELVCLGQTAQFVASASLRGAPAADRQLCTEISLIVATEMSEKPFASFAFDGILGLSLEALALSPEFSAFHTLLAAGRLAAPQFAFFLTEGEGSEESQLALGGFDPRRLLEPPAWAPVVRADLGHWQVKILAVRVDGLELDVCRDGGCRGIVDTGSSHLGVPAPHDAELSRALSAPAPPGLVDCRAVAAPELELVVAGRSLALGPQSYMRRLPREHGSDGSGRSCGPRVMPVKIGEPLGPKLFILGEPLLHRYYTVFDWEAKKVGFALANSSASPPGLQSVVV